MCSICGYFSQEEVPTRIVTDMLQKTEHRGPDAHGLYIDGEIYNCQELRSLLGKDHALEDGNNSSEILLHLIEEIYDGDLLRTVQSVVKMLNGMYSFAVTDGDEVVVARDPAGIKPIYYVEEEGRVYFCSEKKGLYDTEGKIRSIPPGKIMRMTTEGTCMYQGVKIEHPQIDITDFDEAVILYKDTITDAVEKMLRGVGVAKVGMIFSGGVDSVLIAKLISEALSNFRVKSIYPQVLPQSARRTQRH